MLLASLLQTWEVLAGTGSPCRTPPTSLPALGCLFFPLLAWLVSVLSWDGLL